VNYAPLDPSTTVILFADLQAREDGRCGAPAARTSGRRDDVDRRAIGGGTSQSQRGDKAWELSMKRFRADRCSLAICRADSVASSSRGGRRSRNYTQYKTIWANLG